MNDLMPLEAQWSSAAMREYYEFLRSEIAKAMTMPPQLLDAPQREYADWYRTAYEVTAVMREEAMRTYSRYTVPVYTIPAEPLPTAPKGASAEQPTP